MNVSSVVFACYSSACRPPTSGGTGGSSKGGGFKTSTVPEAMKIARNPSKASPLQRMSAYETLQKAAMQAGKNHPYKPQLRALREAGVEADRKAGTWGYGSS